MIVDQVKARLTQIEDQFSQHQRLADELARLRNVVKDLERAVVSRVSGGHPPAAKPTERAKRPSAATVKGPAQRAGFAVATGDYIVTIDADGSTDPAEIERFAGALQSGITDMSPTLRSPRP